MRDVHGRIGVGTSQCKHVYATKWLTPVMPLYLPVPPVMICVLQTSRRTGPAVFARASNIGLEGIVSERHLQVEPDWLERKNPACDAVRREAEEDSSK